MSQKKLFIKLIIFKLNLKIDLLVEFDEIKIIFNLLLQKKKKKRKILEIKWCGILSLLFCFYFFFFENKGQIVSFFNSIISLSIINIK